jgi:RHS repeat-associated protein
VATEYTYEPFGATTAAGASSANAFQYTGRENDATGLYYYRARYYHPGLQRFISEDPISHSLELLVLLVDALYEDPQALNRYGYSANSPLNAIDPLGLWSFKGSFYKGYGGSVTVGRESGRWFVRVGGGVGIGGGVRFYPTGGFPTTPGCAGAPRGFIGSSASLGAALGPLSVEAKGEVGSVVGRRKGGRPMACYVEQGHLLFSILPRDQFGLALGGGVNFIDLGVLFE